MGNTKMTNLYLVGLEVSKGDFVDENTGRSVAYDSLKIHCLTDLAIDKGIGQKYVAMKIKDSSNLQKFRSYDLPCKIKPIYETDYSYSTPRQVLVDIEQVF